MSVGEKAIKAKAAIIGSGHISTDLLVKILRTSARLEAHVMVGSDPESEGLAFAARQGVKVVNTGVARLPEDLFLDDVVVAFDATSAGAHHDNLYAPASLRATIFIEVEVEGHHLPTYA